LSLLVVVGVVNMLVLAVVEEASEQVLAFP
jgi:hypothetical protein